MLTPTLADGLKSYSIGDKLRALRLRKKMGLVELGHHTKLSPAMLSKIERGKLFPTLPTLLRIAMVFSVGLEFFFTDDRKRHVLAISRHKERLKFPEKANAPEVAYLFESLDFGAVERKLNAYYAEFRRIDPNKVRPHQHAGVEFIYVISGSLGLRVGSDDILLEECDSIYFDSSVAHGYWNASHSRTMAVVVTVP
ncbi:MAG TPA: XRE family transcriptional regulator [Terriglobia bacterium]|nr:XRE family transcriptional regulator [Terriglobia bacterium]